METLPPPAKGGGCLVAMVLIVLGASIFLWKQPESLSKLDQFIPGHHEKPEPDPERYQQLVAEVATRQGLLSERYRRAGTRDEKAAIESEAGRYLETMMPELMRCWLGTPWDFNGMAEVPGNRPVACGYFVSTILRDSGFDIERVRLAQQASQNIIATLVPRGDMHIRAGKSYDDYLAEVIARGPGIRIVGLDSHVGFLVVHQDKTISFIHSAGPVMEQDRHHAAMLKISNYRVTGSITGSRAVIEGWLLGKKWPTRI